MMLTTPEQINHFKRMSLLQCLKLEIAGMHRSRGLRTAYSIIKEKYNLKGNRHKVLTQFQEIIDQNRPY